VCLPSAPTDEERDSYFARYISLLVWFGIFGMSGIMWATVHLALTHPALHAYFGLVAVVALFFLISLRVNIFTRDQSLHGHREIVKNWDPEGYASVDVWLPVCGESLKILRNTWNHIAGLAWGGTLDIYVADDADSPEVRALAEEFGFHYMVRENRGWMKKSGNLRFLYEHSDGEFVVIFDADFCPRSDFLYELMPYFEGRVGIVQSPQYFRILPEQNWLERGAGAVQELFYRAIQVSRNQHGGAICVGTNAIYRRTALDANGGTTIIGHSEDVHTGFDLRRHGWDLRYVPVVLATGMCPDDLTSFWRQQYRWCMGSMSLLSSRKFWTTKLKFTTRMCYMAGFGYYISTALNVLVFPILPIVLLTVYPSLVHLHNYLYLLPALFFMYLAFPAWHRCKWGLEAWTVQVIYSWSHLFAFVDIMRRRPMGWTPTGAKKAADRRAATFRIAMTVWSGGLGLLWVSLAAYRFTERTQDFLPMLLLGGFYLMVVARAIIPIKETAR
jgi:cellulose synthase (UDP-forming)